jgi:hypothetical protein
MPEPTGLVRRAQACRKCAHRPLELYIAVALWFVMPRMAMPPASMATRAAASRVSLP